MIKQMHRGYLQEPNNSLYTSKNENIKKGKRNETSPTAFQIPRIRGAPARAHLLQGCNTETTGTSTATPQFRADTAPGRELSPADQRRSVAT